MSAPTQAEEAVEALRTTTAVRTRSASLLEHARAGDSRWFTVDDDALPRVADDVAALTRNRFPDLDIPPHSRWRHFTAGGVDRTGRLTQLFGDAAPGDRARAMIDLTVVSVLLDAGAGADWGYVENGVRYHRSEGLAVASWHGFVDGRFSSDPGHPLRVDADALQALTVEDLAAVLQASPANPLVGLSGRVALMRSLGAALADQPEVFGPLGRPGGLFDASSAASGVVDAHDLLVHLLTSLSRIWPSGNVIDDEPLGDCWRHGAVDGPGATAGWLPLHKLSQWLTYSLIEPLQWAGVTVTGIDRLTGLPEYRNGGLLLDGGVLGLRDPEWAQQSWTPGDELVVEWRGLTVALLDELGPLVRARLGVDEVAMPLACVLEGGTWAAGRESAQRLRGGLPPLNVVSDGTVF
ncbi:URC4/urg3 family protein [Mycolicibacterium sp. 3033]|nr:URC4/urg3 family protein [Mycolicibacterium aurantiacum]